MTSILTVRGLHLARGGRPILQGVNLDARAGEVVALMGLSSAVVDFVFKAQVSTKFSTGESLVGFFALFYMVVSVVSVVSSGGIWKTPNPSCGISTPSFSLIVGTAV